MKFTSRERSEVFANTLLHYFRLAHKPKEMIWLFSLDSDDVLIDQYIHHIRDILPNMNVQICTGESQNKVDAINRDVQSIASPWNILLNISDDQIPIIQGYDEQIRANMSADLDCSLWFKDGRQNRINTQEIIGLNYYKRFSEIYFNEYKSFFCDNEATEVAALLGKQKKIDVCIIRHDHPGWVRIGPHDRLYQRNEKFWNEDEKLYKLRAANKFGIK